jgi:16S rRNA (uracil1498-N3)-methyltransferase
MDVIVQKATELGVARIVPVLSQRSIVRLDKSHSGSKAVHWRAVAVSACEQCGRNRIPVIEAAQPLLDYLGRTASRTGLKLVFEPLCASPVLLGASEAESGAEIAIGPEGGFAADELEAFRVAGYGQAGLGPRILRAETAAIAAVAWLQARFGDMSADSDRESRGGGGHGASPV